LHAVGADKVEELAPLTPVSALPSLTEQGKKVFSYNRDAAYASGSRLPRLAKTFLPVRAGQAQVKTEKKKTRGVSGLVESLSLGNPTKERAGARPGVDESRAERVG